MWFLLLLTIPTLGASTACPAGSKNFFNKSTNADDCTPCSAGKIPNADQTDCINCPPGKYGAVAGAVECLDCSPGYHAPLAAVGGIRIGLVECLQCAIGRYQSLAGQALCIPCNTFTSWDRTWCGTCPAGTYKYGTMCAECAEGKYSYSMDSEVCVACQAGKFSARGQSECTVCPDGQYQDKTSATSCLPHWSPPSCGVTLDGSPRGIAEGTTTRGPVCAVCEKGYTLGESDTGNCKPWASCGKQADNTSRLVLNGPLSMGVCGPCNMRSKEVGDDCVAYDIVCDCSHGLPAVGDQCPGEDVSKCASCYVGRGMANNACTVCPRGKWSPGGSAQCEPCGPNSWSPRGAGACIAQPPCTSVRGASRLLGASATTKGRCVPCGEHQHVVDGRCTCDAGSFLNGMGCTLYSDFYAAACNSTQYLQVVDGLPVCTTSVLAV